MDASSDADEPAAAAPVQWVRHKGYAAVFSVLVVGLTLSPITQNWREKPVDSFPLSYYPMFSARRSETYEANYLVGLDERGERHPIRYTYVGAGGCNQVRRQIGRYVAEDRGDELAREVARRVARKKSPPLGDVVEVRVVRGEFRFDDWFHGDKEPLAESVRGSARVVRGGR